MFVFIESLHNVLVTPTVQAVVNRFIFALEPLLRHVNSFDARQNVMLSKLQNGCEALADGTQRIAMRHKYWTLVFVMLLAAWTSLTILDRLWYTFTLVCRKGIVAVLFRAALSLPGIRTYVQNHQRKVALKIKKDLSAKGKEGGEVFTKLPATGLQSSDIQQRLYQKDKCNVHIQEGHSKLSGMVYIVGEEHRKLLNEAYTMFDLANPMHSGVFPGVRIMEAEVVAMTATMLGGGDGEVCGSMTSGGTESILLAMKAARDYAWDKRGIKKPEMIIATSAHAAYFKAAEYFGFDLIRVEVGSDYRLSASTVRRHMTSNTAVVIASAPGYPHGVVDHVQDIAKVTSRRGVWLHVDACLGGFVMPFARKLGYAIPPFHFEVAGVSSMSVDTHKFGMAHKGTSVVLYRSPELRKYQYTRITDWSGGMYISPGLAGSRNGGLIATAWVSMLHLGEEGYMQATRKIMEAATRFTAAIEEIPELELTGQPESCVVGFKASTTKVDIYKVNDLMAQQGWHLSALQLPPALHMCFTAQHAQVVGNLIQDLKHCIHKVQSDPQCVPDGMAPLYGMAAALPDRTLVGDFLEAYQDALLTV